MSKRLTATEFVQTVVDEGSFVHWGLPLENPEDPDYAAELAAAREKTGLDEAVLTGEATLDGHRVALVVGEFRFLGGSIGHAASDLVLHAVDRATAERIPLLAAPCSGGTRMQEGTAAFVQMVKIGQAVQAHRHAGLVYLVHLRHPTTGGVLASWGSLGQYTTAEPGALVGFLGPRAQEAIAGEMIPEGIQRAENLQERGIIDAVVPNDELRAVWARLLAAAGAPRVGPKLVRREASHLAEEADPWESVQATRHTARPGLVDLAHYECTDMVWFSGTGDGQVDPAVRVGLAKFRDIPCVWVGHDRSASHGEPLSPAGLRLARRGFRLADELNLPVVSIIDTPGAALTQQAEEMALAGEIARTLGWLADLPVPTVSVILGQGGGGAALAMLPADRMLCAGKGWLAPLPPEGASAIVHRNAHMAAEMSRRQGLGAHDLQRDGVVDEVVGEPDEMSGGGAEVFCHSVGEAVAHHLQELLDMPDDQRLARRRERFRSMGR
ncbi:carboxyl transferase domain-containing protein [Luteococcus sp. H138]|uniref:carboxyl transferase domain-containing protein n=1 Tax=unclassified Luteococcus TaxID=2639923 RepID=UPI00313EB6DC